jgi:hypothetical protein
VKVVPEYSDAGLSARDIFHGGASDILVYVEDEDQENLYKIVLQRCLPKFKAAKILPLRGKENVLKHSREDHAHLKGKKRLYLLDLDFDDLLGVLEAKTEVFYWNDYCIELSFLEESSLIKLAVEESPREGQFEIAKKVSYSSVMKNWLHILDRLHRAFYLVQRYDLGLPNCDLAPEKFSSEKGPFHVDKRKVEDYVAQVIARLVERRVIASAKDYEELSRKAFLTGRKDWRRINGKFVMKLWYHQLRHKGVIGNIRMDSFAIRLASHSSLKRLRSTTRSIATYLAA